MYFLEVTILFERSNHFPPAVPEFLQSVIQRIVHQLDAERSESTPFLIFVLPVDLASNDLTEDADAFGKRGTMGLDLAGEPNLRVEREKKQVLLKSLELLGRRESVGGLCVVDELLDRVDSEPVGAEIEEAQSDPSLDRFLRHGANRDVLQPILDDLGDQLKVFFPAGDRRSRSIMKNENASQSEVVRIAAILRPGEGRLLDMESSTFFFAAQPEHVRVAKVEKQPFLQLFIEVGFADVDFAVFGRVQAHRVLEPGDEVHGTERVVGSRRIDGGVWIDSEVSIHGGMAPSEGGWRFVRIANTSKKTCG